MARRSDTDPARFARLRGAYDVVVAGADYEIVESDAEALRHVVGGMASLLDANSG